MSELAPTYGVSLTCELLDLPRSSFYYQVDKPDERDCKVAIQEIAGQWPRYGYTCPTAGAGRRIAVQLRRDKQLVVNSKRVRRLMAEMGLKGEPPRRKRRTTNSEHSFPTRSVRTWFWASKSSVQSRFGSLTSPTSACAVTSSAFGVAVVMDVFTRSIRGWHLGRTLHQELTLTALQRALATGRRPEIHHSDQGVQYAASAYIDALKGTSISMAEVGEAWQNGYAERLVRTIKEEEVTYRTITTIRMPIGNWGGSWMRSTCTSAFTLH